MALIFFIRIFFNSYYEEVINMKRKITLWVVDVFSIMKLIEFIVKRVKRRYKKSKRKNGFAK